MRSVAVSNKLRELLLFASLRIFSGKDLGNKGPKITGTSEFENQLSFIYVVLVGGKFSTCYSVFH